MSVNDLLRALGGTRIFDLAQPIEAKMPVSPNHPGFKMALQRRHGDSFDFWRSESKLALHNGGALELIDAVGVNEFAHTQAIELPYGRKRAL